MTTASEVIRCGWLTKDEIYITYHDEEWGKPEYNSQRLFEMLCLESQQAGLSWLTVLKKRENYRKVFYDFNPYIIVNFDDCKVNELVNDSEIIRHRGKIVAIVNNAKCYVDMERKGQSFSDFVWSFVEGKPIINEWNKHNDVPSETNVSKSMSNAMKQLGFKFIGSTICYAFMQACGLVNDKE